MYRDPEKQDLVRDEFETIWQEIKSWEINVPSEYDGFCSATGNHVMAILDALAPYLKDWGVPGHPSMCGACGGTGEIG